jgi:hypothetical protein
MKQLSLDLQTESSEKAFYTKRVEELKKLGFSLLHSKPTPEEETLAISHQYVAYGTDNLIAATVWCGQNPNTKSRELWSRPITLAHREFVIAQVKEIHSRGQKPFDLSDEEKEMLPAA